MCYRVRVTRYLVVAASLVSLLGRQHEALAQLGPVIPRAERDRVVRIFHLRYAHADSLAGAIRTAFVQDDSSTLQLAVEERTNSLIVYGIAEDLEAVTAVITELDAPVQHPMEVRDPAGEQPARERLLFYWLATAPDFKTEERIPEQLQPVVQELERLGLKNLQHVSRSVAGLDGQRVSLNSTVNAADRTFQLEFEGIVHTGEDAQPPSPRALALNVQVVQLAPPSGFGGGGGATQKRCSLNATVRMPNDHFVVLGVTGLGDLENAFVIQIQSNEPEKRGEEPNGAKK